MHSYTHTWRNSPLILPLLLTVLEHKSFTVISLIPNPWNIRSNSTQTCGALQSATGYISYRLELYRYGWKWLADLLRLKHQPVRDPPTHRQTDRQTSCSVLKSSRDHRWTDYVIARVQWIFRTVPRGMLTCVMHNDSLTGLGISLSISWLCDFNIHSHRAEWSGVQ
jgi:hypothetical protein